MMVKRAISQCIATLLCTVFPAAPILAADDASGLAERAILILDASGSMWGEIDGAHKITIAREVIDGLLQDWDPSVHLGVTAYGHREKGDCSDIEALAPLGPVDKSGIMTAIEGLNPKGKTPLTDAVRQAAEELRYTEERATVILVSDGKETCDADPCAAAAELEANGIDFTVHVVGFDLDVEEKAQLQCVADGTGGQFLNAENASELHEAMAATVELVAEPAPKPKRVVEVASTGAVTVTNTTEKFFIRPSDHVGGGFVTQISNDETVQLQAGSYRLDTSDQERLVEFDVKPGETKTIDMNAFVGFASVTNTTEKFFIRPSDHVGGGFVTQISNDETVQLQAGSYRLDTSDQERLVEFDVKPGETKTIDMNALRRRSSLFVRPIMSVAASSPRSATTRPFSFKPAATGWIPQTRSDWSSSTSSRARPRRST